MNYCHRLYRVSFGLLGVLAFGLVGCTAVTPEPASSVPSAAPAPVTQTVITDVTTEALADAVRVIVQSTGPLEYTAFKLHDPPRLVVDISEASLGQLPQPIPVTGDLVGHIEPLVFPDERIVRLTLHLQRMVSHAIEVQDQQLHIMLTAAESREVTEAPKVPPAGPSVAVSPLSSAKPPAAPAPITETVVSGVSFVSLMETAVLAVQTSGPPPKVRVKQRQEPLRLSLELKGARLAPGQEKVETVSDPGGVVTELRAFQASVTPEARVQIAVHLRAPAPFEVRHDENLIRVVITKPTMTTKALPREEKPLPAASSPSFLGAQRAQVGATAPPAQESEGQPASIEAMAIGDGEAPKRYTGERISLDFQNADINDILRLIAEVSGLNIIAGGDVQGTVTTRMVDVPWDQALDVILKINGLDQERAGNIIRVAPLGRFIAERQERTRAQETEDEAEPTVTQLVPVNYADAPELQSNLERLLSDRGSIFINERTNTLIITDTRKNLDDMLALVETLDRQTPQVMIEARIVETSRNFLEELGVQFGGDYTKITGVKFPNRIDVSGSSSGNFLVDLPAAVETGSGGAITFTLAGASNLLNLRLSALERSGRGKIISNPKIATLDNSEALIQSGRRIPVQTVSAEGTQTEFVDASLSLRVTPHVTPDGFISMRINATKNEADFGNAVNGIPSITTREATTEMLVKDNDTVVIGGLYRRTISSARDGVPSLSRVPFLGWLFRHNQEQDDNDELLIFITPRIIRQPERQGQSRISVSY